MFPFACGGSVGTTWEALLQSIDDVLPSDLQRPLRSCTSRLSRGEKLLHPSARITRDSPEERNMHRRSQEQSVERLASSVT